MTLYNLSSPVSRLPGQVSFISCQANDAIAQQFQNDLTECMLW
jgi:hypothetical protein